MKMEKHATDDGDKATYVMICIQDRTSAAEYTVKHSLKNVVHVVAKPPTEYVAVSHVFIKRDTQRILEHRYKLAYIPHHVVIGKDGKVKMNYDGDYMSHLK